VGLAAPTGTDPAPAASNLPTASPRTTPSAVRRTLQQSQKGLREIQDKLRREQQAREAASKREKNILSRLDGTDRKLERLAREKNANENDLDNTRRRVQDLEEMRGGTEKDLETERDSLSRRLRAMQRGRASTPLLALALGLQNAGSESRRSIFEAELARSNERLMERVEGRREDLIQTSNRLVQEQDRRRRILGALTRQTDRTASERRRREKLLASIRTEKAVRETAIEELDGAAKNLRSKVDELIRQAAEADQEEQAARAAAAKAAATRAARDETPSGDPSPAPVRASPLRGGQGLRRNLPWPARGVVIQSFGKTRHREFNATVASSGLQIQAAQGTPIRAVSAGRVRYADWFEGYGKLVILDHGQGYYSLYAQAADLNVAPGDQVAAGQTIATVGDTGSLVGDSLYFEIRKNGLPQDPRFWLRPKG